MEESSIACQNMTQNGYFIIQSGSKNHFYSSNLNAYFCNWPNGSNTEFSINIHGMNYYQQSVVLVGNGSRLLQKNVHTYN